LQVPASAIGDQTKTKTANRTAEMAMATPTGKRTTLKKPKTGKKSLHPGILHHISARISAQRLSESCCIT
jgi:hypothetical protein